MTMCSSSLALVVSLLALSALASGFVLNIDCGSDSPSKVNGTDWAGDTEYTQSGEPMEVNDPPTSDQVMNTARVFSSGKGCYSVPGVPQQQVLVRASFLYVSYDDNSSPPTFDLLLENSNWTEVTAVNATILFDEVTYFVTGGTVDVCVSQTLDDQIPFMSALEIRSMSTDMYTDFNTSTAFIKRHRVFFGDDPDGSGFVLDKSGRYWHSVMPENLETSDDASSSIPTPDNLPEGALSHAMTVETGSDSLELTFSNLPDDSDVPVYVNMYFSEVNLTAGLRSFYIYVDGDLATDEPIIVLPYGQVSNHTMHHIFANSTTKFSLEATEESDLPPLINGYEVYAVIDIVQPVANPGTPTTLPSGTPTLSSPASTSGTTKRNTLPVSSGTKILTVFWAMVGILYLWGAM